MEDSSEYTSASFADFDEISSKMKRDSSFFMRMKSAIDTMKSLNDFLIDADAKSIERLMSEFLSSLSEQTEAPETVGFADAGSLLDLSNILRQRRVMSFLGRASRRLSKSNERPEESKSVETADPNLFYSFVEEYVDSEAKSVAAWLKEEESWRSVLGLVGPRGIGKTTLARKLYGSEMVRDHFDCYCWIDVSRLNEYADVVKAVIKQMARQGICGQTHIEHGAGCLRRSLLQKRYIFVFDDVCYQEFWDVIQKFLPDNRKGSRVIVTTSSDQVVESCNESLFDRVLKLGPVWNAKALFYRVAFRGDRARARRCSDELKKLSDDILEMCKGFPFPIVGVAGLLSTKEKLVSEWEKVFESFKLELEANYNYPNGLASFGFSILGLPDYLTPCFLYFSMFPKDSLIPTDKLFMLWIAEGFVENKMGKKLEEVAEEYLNELILRGLVRPCHAFHEFGPLCKVNELIHSTARIKADELDFCRVLDGINSIGEGASHRLLIRNNANFLLDNIESQIHSVFLSGVTSSEFLIRNLIYKCGVLTILDFEDCPIENFPEELTEISNLKYLCLKNTKVQKLPESIQKLQKLQTLDCRNTLITELPVGINKLKNLRHLLASGHKNSGVRIKEGFGALVNLQTLMTIEAHFGIIKELPKLKELRKLGISGLTPETSVALCTCIHEFYHLESLTLQAMTSNKVLDLRTIDSSSLPHLKSLVLKGRLLKLPTWIFSLQNLNTLWLSLSRLTIDSMKRLSLIPNLESLCLHRAYEGEELYFEEGGFEKLKLLVIRELRGLNALEIEDGALPMLEELRIGSSPSLNEVPIGIRHLRNLKVLANYDMPKELVVSVQPNGGSEFWKVEHIASVVFLYRVRGRDYRVFELGDSDLLNYLLGLEINGSNIVHHPHENELSFSESEYEEDDDVSPLSFYSFASTFFTDDLEE